MSYKGERTFVTGVYKCKDPIKNFKIRVKLKQDKSSLIPLPQFHLGAKNSIEEGSKVKEAEFEETTIRWQEKFFSAFELSYYKYPGNCHTPLDQKYHNEVLEFCKNGKTCNRLFTYTDADNFSPDNSTSLLSNTSNCLDTNALYHGKTELHQRQSLAHYKSRRERNISSQCIVDYAPSDKIKKQNHFLQCSIQTLYILADLSSKESDLRKEEDWHGYSEYVLCTLKYNTASKILTVTPDFNSTSVDAHVVPYYIEVDGDSRNTFQYWLEHASTSIIPEKNDDETEFLRKLLDHQLDIRQMKVGNEFRSPKSNILLVHLLGEIVGAEDFEYDDIFVHFFFELPKGWTCENQQQLSGVTHRCRTRGTGMAYFCHLFESQLSLNLDILDEKTDVVPGWPQFFAEVLALDSWGRHRVEGYGHIKIPPTAGIHSITLPMWRPLGNGSLSDLQRFFIGGSPGVEDISSVGVPTTFEGDRLSKFGLRVVASGKLHLRIHVMHQSKITTSDLLDSTDAKNRKHARFLLERLNASTLVNSVNSVMAAFKRARDRMLQAKEGIPT